jgi:hypothetical protein
VGKLQYTNIHLTVSTDINNLQEGIANVSRFPFMIEYLFGFDIGKFIIGAHRIALFVLFHGFIIWFYVFMFST